MKRRLSPKPSDQKYWLMFWLVLIALALLLLCVQPGCVQYQHDRSSPNPSPSPAPSPTPAPVSGAAFAIVVHEETETTLDQSALLNDLKFWRGLAPIRYRFLDDDLHPQVDPYLEVLARAKVAEPALIVLDSQGKVLRVAPLPKDSAGVAALLQ